MDRIIGQTAAVEALQTALRSDRMHHAWIFAGPAGVGKCTTAIELARLLLDPDAGRDLAGNFSADPVSRVGRMVAAGSHPDLHLIRKELALHSSVRELARRKLISIPLDLLREHMLGGRTNDDKRHDAAAYRTPVEGHAKVFIIDEAELMDAAGQNALLKTLEEPPPSTYIILVTSRPERLLPTVLSRSQLVRFGPLDNAAMDRWRAASDLETDDANWTWAATFAEGSPGLAALAVEYDFHRWATEFQPMLRDVGEGRYHATLATRFAEFVDGFAEAWVSSHDNASKDAANKAGAGHLFRLLSAHARAGLEGACRGNTGVDPWLRMIDLIRDTEAHLEANVNPKMAFENFVAQWTAGHGAAMAGR